MRRTLHPEVQLSKLVHAHVGAWIYGGGDFSNGWLHGESQTETKVIPCGEAAEVRFEFESYAPSESTSRVAPPLFRFVTFSSRQSAVSAVTKPKQFESFARVQIAVGM